MIGIAKFGAYCNEIVMPAENVYKIPDGMDFVSAASFLAFQQANDFVQDEEKMEFYNTKLEERWSDLKLSPLLGPMLNDNSNATDSTLVEDLTAMGLLEDEEKFLMQHSI